MIRLTWLQFRSQAAVALAALAAAAIVLAITGRNLAHLYDISGIATCNAQGNCGTLDDAFLSHYKFLRSLLDPAMLAVPALLGSFWGAPLIARELETGTYRLAWTQSVTRTRWLAVKIAVVGLASISVAGLFSLMVTWWFSPITKVSMTGASPLSVNRFTPGVFDARNIVPIGYAAFAFALGATAGLLLRRTVPALAVTLAVFAGIQTLVPNVIRPNLLPSTTITFRVNQATASRFTGIYTSGGGAEIHLVLPVPHGAWVTSAPPVETASGQVAPASSHLNCMFSGGAPAKTRGPDLARIVGCLARYDLHESVTYQPASHYWPLSGTKPESSSRSPQRSQAPASGGSGADGTDPADLRCCLYCRRFGSTRGQHVSARTPESTRSDPAQRSRSRSNRQLIRGAGVHF